MVAQVIVDVVHTNVARPFSYLIPEGMDVCIGMRVLVPLGRRQVDGFVVELISESQTDVPPEKLRPILKCLMTIRRFCLRFRSWRRSWRWNATAPCPKPFG